MTRKTIDWSADKLADFEVQYSKAKTEGTNPFWYEEKEGRRVVAKHEMDQGYARYLIEYLREQFAANPTPPARPNKEGMEGQ
jgi:hypothetical protein